MPSFLDSIAGAISAALGLPFGADSWDKRLRETIILTAPNGAEFEGRWRGSPHTITNKAAIHTFPGVAGARVQDLRAGEEIYNIVIFFTGTDHDTNSAAFMNSLNNNEGDWRIEHPTKGPLFCIWLDATEQDLPVDSGGVTAIETNWIINLPETETDSAAQAQAQANFQASIANGAAAGQFSAKAILDAPGKITAVINTVGSAISSARKTLSIVENASILDPRLTAISTAIQNTLDGDIIDTTLLAGQFQQYLQIFGLGQPNSNAGIRAINAFVEDMTSVVPTQATEDGLAQVATTEMCLNAALTTAAEVALIGGNNSRAEVVTASINLANMFNTVQDTLDNIQALYADNRIVNKFVAQDGAYADLVYSNTLSIRFLFQTLYGLPSERRIILRQDYFPPQLVFEQYGSLGIGRNPEDPGDPFNLSIFYTSNDLHDDDLWYLEHGREVLIYV